MALKTHLTSVGVITKSHMSFIEDEIAEKIRLKFREQIDAEKKAERDRKHFIEMKHQHAIKIKHDAEEAAHPKPVEKVEEIFAEPIEEAVVKPTPLPEPIEVIQPVVTEVEAPQVENNQVVTESTKNEREQTEEKPERIIRVPYQQHTPPPRSKPEFASPKGAYRDRPQGQTPGAPRPDRPQGQYQGAPRTDRPQGQYQGTPRPDRPQGQYQGAPRTDRVPGQYQGAPRTDRVPGQYQGAPRTDRPQGQYQGTPRPDRPQGQYQGAPRTGDRPQGQYQGAPRTGDRPQGAYQGTSRPGDRPTTGYQGSRPAFGSDPRKRPDFPGKKPLGGVTTPPRKAPAAGAGAATPKEGDPTKQKFGKSKISHEELGDKSKHRKALITKTKAGKPKSAVVEPTESEEAEISRSIKRTLAKTQKKKKYHREAQQLIDKGISDIVIREYTSVSELAKIMGVSPSEIITKFFMMGQLVTMNQRLDKDSLEMICDEFSFSFRFEDEYGSELIEKENEQYSDVEYIHRPPVVTIMGHVDHGKTSILDYIRNTSVVAGESGGITQHIGAYQIEVNKHKITFLDTPGHEAFTAMRSRGANVTDIAVIVIAATEGVKPQTVEAIDHARAAGVSMIIALNKIDLPDVNLDKVIAQILDQGVYLETYGGEVPWCKTSTKTGEGILNLIELILLTAEMKELKARKDVPADAVVIEAEKDTRMGTLVTILMREGTLSKGDAVVCGATFGRVRKITNERGVELKTIYPSDVAIVYGLNDVPKAGDLLNQVDNEKTARSISGERQQIRMEREKYQNKSSLQNIFARIKEDKISELKLIIKADSDGSVEALADSFQKLSNDEVAVNVIRKGVGGINEADVSLASASDAIIIGFHVRANPQTKKMAEDEHIEIKTYQVIYDAIDDVKKGLEGLLKPEFEERVLGTLQVRQVFKIKKVGIIAGCFVDKGTIQRACKVRLFRHDVLLHEGKLATLKHYQNEVSKVEAGSDCGLCLENYQDIREGDVIECYVLEELAKRLL